MRSHHPSRGTFFLWLSQKSSSKKNPLISWPWELWTPLSPSCALRISLCLWNETSPLPPLARRASLKHGYSPAKNRGSWFPSGLNWKRQRPPEDLPAVHVQYPFKSRGRQFFQHRSWIFHLRAHLLAGSIAASPHHIQSPLRCAVYIFVSLVH